MHFFGGSFPTFVGIVNHSLIVGVDYAEPWDGVQLGERGYLPLGVHSKVSVHQGEVCGGVVRFKQVCDLDPVFADFSQGVEVGVEALDIVDDLELAVVLVIDDVHIVELETIVPDLAYDKFAARVGLSLNEETATGGEHLVPSVDNLLAGLEEVAREVGVDNRVLREVFDVRRLGHRFFLLLGDEDSILANPIAELGFSSPDVVVHKLFDWSPGEPVVLAHIQHVVFDAVNSSSWPAHDSLQRQNFSRGSRVEFERMEIQRIVYKLPGFAAIFGYPVVSGIGTHYDVIVIDSALAHSGEFPTYSEIA